MTIKLEAFSNTDMDRQRFMQKKFLASICSDKNEYTGQSIANAHAHLRNWGLTTRTLI